MKYLLKICLIASSVVTSVSVIMDTGNGSKAIFTDAVGKPMSKPPAAAQLASPINLLNPDRYEFYTFDDSGDLVKRLMTLEEIQHIIASGDSDGMSYNPDAVLENSPEKKVDDVVNNVQNVLKEQIEKNSERPVLEDLSSTWTMVLPAVFENSGEEIVPDGSLIVATPETIMIEPTQTTNKQEIDNRVTETTIMLETKSDQEDNVTLTATLVPENANTNQEVEKTTENAINIEKGTTTPFEKFSTFIPVSVSSFASLSTQNSATLPTDSPSPENISNPSSVSTPSPLSSSNLPVFSTSISSSSPVFLSSHSPIESNQIISTTEASKENPQGLVSEADTQPLSSTSSSTLPFQTWSSIYSSTSSEEIQKAPATEAVNDSVSLKENIQDSTIAAESIENPRPSGSSFLTWSSISSGGSENRPSTEASSASNTITENLQSTTVPTEAQNKPSSTLGSFTTIPISSTTSSLKETEKESFPSTETFSVEGIESEPTIDSLITKESSQTSPSVSSSTYPENVYSGLVANTQSTYVFKDEIKPISSDTVTEFSASKKTSETPFTETTTREESITEFSVQTTQQPATIKISNQNPTVESTKTPLSAEELPSSTYSFLTTFFGMNISAPATKAPETTTTTSNEKPSTIDALDIEKLAVTELLDQLLLSSTKIYQVNPELAQEENEKNEAEEATVESKEDVTTQKPEQASTEHSVISSIEQLLSQAMLDVEESVENTTQHGQKVHEFIMGLGEKNMSEVQEQTATVMSSLMGNLDVDLIKQQNEDITNRNVFKNMSVDTEEPPFDESVDSLISQVMLEELSNATTIVDDLSLVTSTTQTNDEENKITIEALLPKNDEETEITTPTAESLTTTQQVLEDKLQDTTERGTSKITDFKQESSSAAVVLETTEQPTERINPTTSEASTTTFESVEGKTEVHFIATEAQKQTTIKLEETSTVPLQEMTTFAENLNSQSPPSEVKWAPVSTIVPSTPVSTSEKLPSIVSNPTTPLAPSVDLSSQISAGFGLEDTTSQLDVDIYQFVQLCNELAFTFWKSTSASLSPSRSLVVSPFAATSLLAMVFLGARGATSGEMNEILKLDDMVTFNPHLIFRNVTESIEVSKRSGVAASAFVRELYSDKGKGKLLSFYKERARQFYDGHVEEANFKEIGDVIRRRTNLLVKRYTWGKIHEFIKENSIRVCPPLAGVSVNVFHTDCSAASTAHRDGEIYFQVSPTIRQRRLIPIPAVVWRSNFLAGYDPGVDATAVAIGTKDDLISTIFVMPGQQGIAAPGDGLARLERRLIDGAFKDGSWIRLLKSLIPRTGLEVQIPRFSHRSFVNATLALQKMGLRDLFDARNADLRGLNGVSHELYLSDIMQINNFATCGEGRIDETHHIETYPSTSSSRKLRDAKESGQRLDEGEEPRVYQRAIEDALLGPDSFSIPLPLRPRQARIPEIPKLRFDRPFLYFVRHNPTGLIMHMGRFNPRLLP